LGGSFIAEHAQDAVFQSTNRLHISGIERDTESGNDYKEDREDVGLVFPVFIDT